MVVGKVLVVNYIVMNLYICDTLNFQKKKIIIAKDEKPYVDFLLLKRNF